jgi:hypothetical protein
LVGAEQSRQIINKINDGLIILYLATSFQYFVVVLDVDFDVDYLVVLNRGIPVK